MLSLEALIQQCWISALTLDFRSLGKKERILNIDAEVAHGIFYLGMTQ